MKKKTTLTDYKNFWLIWLNAAGSKEGMSLFSMQTKWGIKTNYLYHNEAGLKTPLYVRMIKDGYLEKSGKRLKANFSWISTYVKNKYRVPDDNNQALIPYNLINQKWAMIQDFIQANHDKLFHTDNLRVLFKNDKDMLGDQGRHVFSDIFLFVLLTDIATFARRYHSEITIGIIKGAMSLFADRDLVNYMKQVNAQIGGEVPEIISNEQELNNWFRSYALL